MFSLYFQPFVIFISSRVGFDGWIGVLIASVPDLCMLFTFVIVLVIVLLTGSKQDENCNYFYIKKNDPGVLFALRYRNLVKSINVPFVTVILCQINSLSQKKDHFNRTTIIFKELIIVCMLFTSSYLQNEHFPANRQGFYDILLIWPNFY